MQALALTLSRVHALSIGLNSFVNPELNELLERGLIRCPPFQFNVNLFGDHEVGLGEFLLVLVELFCQLRNVSTRQLVSQLLHFFPVSGRVFLLL